MKRILESGRIRSVTAGILALIVYGGWAYYVNSPYGVSAGIRAASVQGGYSLVLTLSTTLLMEGLYHSLQSIRPGGGNLVLTVLLTSAVTFTTAWVINRGFGTPRIFMTILPGFLIGTAYTIAYVFALHKLHGNSARQREHQC